MQDSFSHNHWPHRGSTDDIKWDYSKKNGFTKAERDDNIRVKRTLNASIDYLSNYKKIGPGTLKKKVIRRKVYEKIY